MLSKMQTNIRNKCQTTPKDTHIIAVAQDIK